jgi:hypothetical protein
VTAVTLHSADHDDRLGADLPDLPMCAHLIMPKSGCSARCGDIDLLNLPERVGGHGGDVDVMLVACGGRCFIDAEPMVDAWRVGQSVSAAVV